MHQDDPGLGGLPAPGKPVFYPKVGHCVYRGLTEDRAAPGKKLVELEDLEEGSRILIPTERVPKLGLRPAGHALDEIEQELSSEFEQSSAEEGDLDGLIEELVNDGSPRNLAKGLKRLHLLRQTTGLSREEEQTRRKIRSWLAAEVAISKDCTRAEAQALITRILQEAMNAHRRREREVAKERRRQVKAQKAAEDAAVKETEEAGVEAARSALFASTVQEPGSAETIVGGAETPSVTPEPAPGDGEATEAKEAGEIGGDDAARSGAIAEPPTTGPPVVEQSSEGAASSEPQAASPEPQEETQQVQPEEESEGAPEESAAPPSEESREASAHGDHGDDGAEDSDERPHNPAESS